MKQLLYVSSAIGIAMTIAAIPAYAQQPAATMPTPANSATVPSGCGKAPMKRHDHVDAQGFGISSASKATGAPCGHDNAESASGEKVKKKPSHNHAQFHKNQP
ncbi:hypothetical protein [Variovorax sp. JS1663]|uniref:hypothetical protein n=1 Tax=Variovorax sp. JS1663 TaxID=1851577 RepID=UPI00117DD091|nr:hypothetical protein [Variovorax sp. JS1663]